MKKEKGEKTVAMYGLQRPVKKSALQVKGERCLEEQEEERVLRGFWGPPKLMIEVGES